MQAAEPGIPRPRRQELLEVVWIGQRKWDLVIYLRRTTSPVEEPAVVFVCTLQWWYQPTTSLFGSAWEIEGHSPSQISRLFHLPPPQ